MKVKISNVIIDLPEELVNQIPFFQKYIENKNNFVLNDIIDIDEPNISLSGLCNIIDKFQGKDVKTHKEHYGTYDFLGIDYGKDTEELWDELLLKPTPHNIKYNVYDTKLTTYKWENEPIKIMEDEIYDIIDTVFVEIELPDLPKGCYWKENVGLDIIENATLIFNINVKQRFYIVLSNDIIKLYHNIDYRNQNYTINNKKIIIPLNFIHHKTFMNYFGLNPNNLHYSINLKLNNINDFIINYKNNDININNINIIVKSLKIFLNNAEQFNTLISRPCKLSFIMYKTTYLQLKNMNKILLSYANDLLYLSLYSATKKILIKTDSDLIEEYYKIDDYYIFDNTNKITLNFTEKRNHKITIIEQIENYILFSPFLESTAKYIDVIQTKVRHLTINEQNVSKYN